MQQQKHIPKIKEIGQNDNIFEISITEMGSFKSISSIFDFD